MAPLPITAIIVTKNEETQIAACLDALQDIEQILVVDSNSTDRTCEIANTYTNVRTINFTWNGHYPKKRQWCLDNAQDIEIQYNWILFIDADEHATPALMEEIRTLFSDEAYLERHAGFFICGHYSLAGKTLKHGLHNNKLALINRHKITFPELNDQDISGMGEIEGHYQPIRKGAYKAHKIGQLKSPLIHNALDDMEGWHARHKRYAAWESAMDRRKAWPREDNALRQAAKSLFKALPARGLIAFLHSYILKLGFLDGVAGYQFAKLRKHYYDEITRLKRAKAPRAAHNINSETPAS